MNVCLYTMHSEVTIGKMAALTVPNKLEYCRRHGYAFHWEPWQQAMFPGFERLPVLIHLLRCGYYDWIFWLGTDCLITNLKTRIEDLVDPAHGIILACDFCQIQFDSFLIQRRHGGLEILEEVWNHRNHPIGEWYEQSTLDALMHNYNGTVKIVPQRTLNSYDHRLYADWGEKNHLVPLGQDIYGNDGRWARGDFVFHIPGRPLETKLKALRSKLHQIVR